MATLVTFVPEDPTHPGWDVFGVGLDSRGHFIHEVLARATEPMALIEIASQAKTFAIDGGYPVKENTFSTQTTRNHLVYLRDKPDKGYVEQVNDGRWQLTERAKLRLKNPNSAVPNGTNSANSPDTRVVDEKCRLVLPKEFANCTVILERVSDSELRIRRSVVIAEADLPFLEDSLQPLSDRDRDLFLSLIENPPKQNQALRDAIQRYDKANE